MLVYVGEVMLVIRSGGGNKACITTPLAVVFDEL